MEDSGKHSALRQAEDGSYEFVIDDHGLHEISEVEPSVAEVTLDEPRLVAAPASKRVVGIAAGGVLLLAALAVAGWVLLGPNADNDTEVENVPGFRAYTGGGAAKGRANRPQPTLPPDEAPEPAPEEPPPEVVEEVEEITESEPGWELGEAEEVVEVEVEPEGEEVAEPSELEGTEGEVPVRGLPKLKGRGLNGLTRPGIGRGFRAPKMPTINTNPIATGRLKPLPIRNINPVPVPEGEEGEEIEAEVVEEEVEE